MVPADRTSPAQPALLRKHTLHPCASSLAALSSAERWLAYLTEQDWLQQVAAPVSGLHENGLNTVLPNLQAGNGMGSLWAS